MFESSSFAASRKSPDSSASSACSRIGPKMDIRTQMNALRDEMRQCFEKDMVKFQLLRKEWETLNMQIEGDEERFDEGDKDTSWLDDEQFYCERVMVIENPYRITIRPVDLPNVFEKLKVVRKLKDLISEFDYTYEEALVEEYSGHIYIVESMVEIVKTLYKIFDNEQFLEHIQKLNTSANDAEYLIPKSKAEGTSEYLSEAVTFVTKLKEFIVMLETNNDI